MTLHRDRPASRHPNSASVRRKSQFHPKERWSASCCALNKRDGRSFTVELTHLAIRPDSFGLILVQERDRIGRVTPSARWVWKRELRSPVEDLAIGSEGFAAATTNEGQLTVFDPVGEPTVGSRFDPSDPPLLIEAPEGSPPGIAWLALSRRLQQLSGHDLRGKVVWNRQIPWEGWSMVKLSRFAIVASADGRVLALDGSGKTRFEGTASGSSNDVFSIDEHGEPLRVSR